MVAKLHALLNNIYSGISVEESIPLVIPYGKEAIDCILGIHNRSMAYNDLPKDRDARDAYDDMQEALYLLFKNQKDYYLSLLETGTADNLPYLFTLTWLAGSLQYAESIPFLIKGLKNKEQYSRWSCCESLIKFKSQEVMLALIGAIRDRASLVRSTAIDGIVRYDKDVVLPYLTTLLKVKGVKVKAEVEKAISRIKSDPGTLERVHRKQTSDKKLQPTSSGVKRRTGGKRKESRMETVEYPASLQWVGTLECPNCQTVTRAWRSSGMSDMRPHFYCDRCSNVIHRVSDYEKTYCEKSEKILDEISASLPACPCGGRFKPGANPKCPKCGMEFAHQNTPLERLSDPHMIVMDGTCVFSEKNDPYRVVIIDR